MNFENLSLYLKVISKYTNSCVLTSDYTVFSDTSKKFIGKINTPDIEEDIGFYNNINKFLKLSNLLENKDSFEIKENRILIKDGKSEINFLLSDPEFIIDTDKVKSVLESFTEGFDEYCLIDVDEILLTKLNNAFNTIDNAFINLKCEDGELFFIVYSEDNSVNLKIESGIAFTEELDIKYDNKYFSKFVGPYKLQIYKNGDEFKLKAFTNDVEINSLVI